MLHRSLRVSLPITLLTCLVAATTGCTARSHSQVTTHRPEPAAPPARQQSPKQSNAQKPLVAIVTTGGTIAMKQDAAAGGAVPALTGEMLVQAVPALRDLATLRVVPVCNIDSRRMAPKLWLAQLRAIRDQLADPTVAGVVVTHGTDTMEDSAYFIERLLPRTKPIAYTGAARSADVRDADGPRNLLNAVRQVLDPHAAEYGVTLTLGSQIHAAAHATKLHTNHPNAFASPRYGPVGEHDGRGVVWLAPPPRETPSPNPATINQLLTRDDPALPRVDLVTCYPGADGSLLDAAVQSGAAGVVVVGYGLGNVNDPMFAAIRRARDRDVAITLTSRVPHGRVYSEYGGAGGGASLRELGVQLDNTRPAHKLRIDLMLQLLAN